MHVCAFAFLSVWFTYTNVGRRSIYINEFSHLYLELLMKQYSKTLINKKKVDSQSKLIKQILSATTTTIWI